MATAAAFIYASWPLLALDSFQLIVVYPEEAKTIPQHHAVFLYVVSFEPRALGLVICLWRHEMISTVIGRGVFKICLFVALNSVLGVLAGLYVINVSPPVS